MMNNRAGLAIWTEQMEYLSIWRCLGRGPWQSLTLSVSTRPSATLLWHALHCHLRYTYLQFLAVCIAQLRLYITGIWWHVPVTCWRGMH